MKADRRQNRVGREQRTRRLRLDSELAPRERRAFGACVGGWALDAMDVQMYGFVIPALIATWGITRGQAGAASNGGVRWYRPSADGSPAGLPTVSAECARCSWRSCGLRCSLSFPASRKTINNCSRPALSSDSASAASGQPARSFSANRSARNIAAKLSALCKRAGPWDGPRQRFCMPCSSPSCRRRQHGASLFMVGIAPAMLVFFVRRYVEEPPVYLESRAKLAANGERPSFLEIFRPPLLRVTLLGGLMGTGAQGGYNAVMTFLPTFLRTERGLSVLDSTGLSGRADQRRVLRLPYRRFFIGPDRSPAAVPRFRNRRGHRRRDATRASRSATARCWCSAFPLGFFASGVFSAMGAFYAEILPDTSSWRWTGLHLQSRTSDGSILSDIGGISLGDHAVGPGDRRFRRDRLRHHGRRGISCCLKQKEKSSPRDVSRARCPRLMRQYRSDANALFDWRTPRLGQGGAASRRRRRRGGSFKAAQHPYRFPRSAPISYGTYDVGQPPRQRLRRSRPALRRRGVSFHTLTIGSG